MAALVAFMLFFLGGRRPGGDVLLDAFGERCGDLDNLILIGAVVDEVRMGDVCFSCLMGTSSCRSGKS